MVFGLLVEVAPIKDVLKYCMIPLGEVFVTMVGIQEKQVLSVGNWAIWELCLYLVKLNLDEEMEEFGWTM